MARRFAASPRASRGCARITPSGSPNCTPRSPQRGAPQSAEQVIPVLFRRELDLQQRFFAMGEAIAHLNHLWRDRARDAQRRDRRRDPLRRVKWRDCRPICQPRTTMSTPAPAASAATPACRRRRRPTIPVALAESLASAAEKSAKLMGEFAARNAGKQAAVASDELGLGKAFMELAAKMLTNPARLAEGQMNLWRDYMSLWQSSMLRMMGAPAMPVAEPAKGDKRFKDAGWHEHFLFDYVKQSYLITARWLHDQVGERRGHVASRRRRRSTSSRASTSTRSRRRTSR